MRMNHCYGQKQAWTSPIWGGAKEVKHKGETLCAFTYIKSKTGEDLWWETMMVVNFWATAIWVLFWLHSCVHFVKIYQCLPWDSCSFPHVYYALIKGFWKNEWFPRSLWYQGLTTVKEKSLRWMVSVPTHNRALSTIPQEGERGRAVRSDGQGGRRRNRSRTDSGISGVWERNGGPWHLGWGALGLEKWGPSCPLSKVGEDREAGTSCLHTHHQLPLSQQWPSAFSMRRPRASSTPTLSARKGLQAITRRVGPERPNSTRGKLFRDVNTEYANCEWFKTARSSWGPHHSETRRTTGPARTACTRSFMQSCL